MPFISETSLKVNEKHRYDLRISQVTIFLYSAFNNANCVKEALRQLYSI